jgi:hypothetical protein
MQGVVQSDRFTSVAVDVGDVVGDVGLRNEIIIIGVVGRQVVKGWAREQ